VQPQVLVQVLELLLVPVPPLLLEMLQVLELVVVSEQVPVSVPDPLVDHPNPMMWSVPNPLVDQAELPPLSMPEPMMLSEQVPVPGPLLLSMLEVVPMCEPAMLVSCLL
jgi:hypothetical protein